MRCFIGLGSNIGAADKNIQKALELLRKDGKITVKNVSSLYETEPMGVKEQSKFINAVCETDTEYQLHGLFRALKGIEGEMGRQKAARYGPRIIDLDILFCGETIFQDAVLTVPHPRLAGRSFVLYPLEEIAPEFKHPITGETIRALKAMLKEGLGIRKI